MGKKKKWNKMESSSYVQLIYKYIIKQSNKQQKKLSLSNQTKQKRRSRTQSKTHINETNQNTTNPTHLPYHADAFDKKGIVSEREAAEGVKSKSTDTHANKNPLRIGVPGLQYQEHNQTRKCWCVVQCVCVLLPTQQTDGPLTYLTTRSILLAIFRALFVRTEHQ